MIKMKKSINGTLRNKYISSYNLKYYGMNISKRTYLFIVFWHAQTKRVFNLQDHNSAHF